MGVKHKTDPKNFYWINNVNQSLKNLLEGTGHVSRDYHCNDALMC